MLDRFWAESKNMACAAMKKILTAEEEANNEYTLSLSLSSSLDITQKARLPRSLFSFFAMNMTATW